MTRYAYVCCSIFIIIGTAWAVTPTYNETTTINLREHGIPADERATNMLLAEGNLVYGVTSGDQCHVYRFDPAAGTVAILATLPGPNTVLRGMALDGDTLYVGTMLSKRQLWLKLRKDDPGFDPEDANLIPIKDSDNTGHLYKITGITSDTATVEDLGVPVAKQGINTIALDAERGIIHGITYPNGRYFAYDLKNGTTQTISFGTTYTNVSNHRVGIVEVEHELADLTPGEGEWNNRLVSRAMQLLPGGAFITSGWQGQILKYTPTVTKPEERFSEMGFIPSIPGRQYWNRIDAIAERDGKLYLGTSDGYIVRFDPYTSETEILGKPIRAIEVMGMAFSPLDGKLYGVSGGGLEGMSRLWSCDVDKGTFEIDIPALQVIKNRHRVGDLVITENGTLVIAEATRIGNLYALTPGTPKAWEKGGILPEFNPQESAFKPSPEDRFEKRKKLEIDVYPIPSAYHGGSGYTAIQADNDGKVYVGTAYYGKAAFLVQLDPETAEWRCLFRSDELQGQYGRGQGIPGKIHTKLRLGSDGKIYGAMKQGYEMHYTIRPDVGEAPEGVRGSQITCNFFSYDPATDTALDLGPGWPQEGITAFDVDIDRGYLYGGTVPGVYYLVYDLNTNRVWNAGQIAYTHPTRYMPKDPGTGKVYHPSETTADGTSYMTVWEPEHFRLRDVEVVPEEGFTYRHSYATACGPDGTNTLYGASGDYLFEMNLDDSRDGKFHVRPVCPIGVEGSEKHSGIYAIERGPDGRIYWTSIGGRDIPLDIFAWDPKTETKTYLGSCASGGDWIQWCHMQGICFDAEGNMAMHILYAQITEDQQKHWKVAEDFFYEDIPNQEHYLGYPKYDIGTFYSVFYLKNATGIK